ncbi:hypothetical protein FRC02_010290 [Tulasnella sp. 418]|nr:hypothetical protein FRC02_010290 [Tulasnella sp. 418]
MASILSTQALHYLATSHKGVAEEPYKYVYPGAAGEGVVIYVLDTGVYIQHSEFEGRASYGISFQGDPDDKHGHGTHVSGTAIGKTYGAAKKAKVVSVKVLNDDGKGLVSTMIAGIDWVIQQTSSPSPSAFGITAIINMSCGAWADDALDDAVTIAALFGVVPVVAAGNDGGDASERSPSRADAAFTVGSINVEDHLAHNSNHGDCVNIYAPGSKILSAGIGDRDATAYKSGTSMATPHVSGTFALYLSLMGTERPGLPASWLKGIPYSVLKGIVTVKSDETKEGLNVVQVP